MLLEFNIFVQLVAISITDGLINCVFVLLEEVVVCKLFHEKETPENFEPNIYEGKLLNLRNERVNKRWCVLHPS